LNCATASSKVCGSVMVIKLSLLGYRRIRGGTIFSRRARRTCCQLCSIVATSQWSTEEFPGVSRPGELHAQPLAETEREALASLGFHQANVPATAIRQ
jgi:hypothetical protein